MNSIIYIHIGTEKTGTTSLQKTLNINREKLLENSILYPKSAGGINSYNLIGLSLDTKKKSAFFIDKKLKNETDKINFRIHTISHLKEEFNLYKPEKIIFSLEHLSRLLETQQEILSLKECLSNISNNIRIIIYLRPQDEFYISWYITKIKTGYTGLFSFPNKDKSDWKSTNYISLIDRWSNVFGKENLIIRPYKEAITKSNGVVGDFFELIGLSDKDLKFGQWSNKSIDAVSLEILRRLNHHIGPSYLNKAPNKYRDSIRLAFEAASSGPAFYPSFEDRARFMEYFYSDNKFINENYFNGKCYLPTCENELKVKESYQGNPTDEDIYEKFSLIWKYSRDQIFNLRNTVNKLKNSRNNT